MADTVVKIAVTAVVAVTLLMVWRRWLEPALIAVALAFEATAFISITAIVDRPRPDVLRLEQSPVGSSFPSGHVAAAVVYGAIVIVVFWHTRSRPIRTFAVCLVAFVVAAVTASRMYRGMHHPSDVVAGVLLGGVSLWITQWVIHRAMCARIAEPDQSATTRETTTWETTTWETTTWETTRGEPSRWEVPRWEVPRCW